MTVDGLMFFAGLVVAHHHSWAVRASPAFGFSQGLTSGCLRCQSANVTPDSFSGSAESLKHFQHTRSRTFLVFPQPTQTKDVLASTSETITDLMDLDLAPS